MLIQLSDRRSSHIDYHESGVAKETLHRDIVHLGRGKPSSGSYSYVGKYGESNNEIKITSKWGAFRSKDLRLRPTNNDSFTLSSDKVGDFPVSSRMSVAVAGFPVQLNRLSAVYQRSPSVLKGS
jgi:hypothetical protein